MTTDDPYATFRPVGGRIIPLVVGVLCVGLFTVVAIAAPGKGFAALDRIGIIAIGVAIAAMMWRFAQVRAVPTPEGLTVHNLIVTRDLTWTQIVEVQFGGGAPWPTLELDDFDTCAVMGIQRSDGPRAIAEASRLAALVEAHSRPAADH